MVPPGLATAQTPARLLGWDDRAILVPNRGPGIEYFRLPAVIAWEPTAGRAPGRYSLLVQLPDGSTSTSAIPPDEAPPSRRLTVLVPSSSVRDLRPDRVIVRAWVVDSATGQAASNSLVASIEDFPNPGRGQGGEDVGPFGWGTPLQVGTSGAAELPRPGPDGLTFARIVPGGGKPGFFLATTEVDVKGMKARLPGYDPKAGRSDEFELDAPNQPAINVSADKAVEYLAALTKADPSGVSYRLPTREEWSIAARAGKSSPFWWGDSPTDPAGANFLGPEPSLPTDTTAPARPPATGEGFAPNPWGLFHTFGNAAEWAATGDGGFVRLGGDFRTEPASPLPEVAVPSGDSTGPDAFVGVRPAFALSAETGTALARKALGAEPEMARLAVAFDPDRSLVTISGKVSSPRVRRLADSRIAGLWWVAAVDDRLETPGSGGAELVKIGPEAGNRRRFSILGRPFDEVELRSTWTAFLPVEGSHWFVNVGTADGASASYPMNEPRPEANATIAVRIDRSRFVATAGLRLWISLGGEAARPDAPNVVSNVVVLAR